MIQGTEDLIRYADNVLPKRAEDIESFIGHHKAATDLLQCAEIIKRLAHYDPEINHEPGEN